MCGCADRMRKYVLPKMGYHLVDREWVHPTREKIPDSEVDSHHSRLTLEILRDEGRDKARRLHNRLKGRW